MSSSTLNSGVALEKFDNSRGSQAIPFSDVVIEDAFWTPRLNTVKNKTLPLMYHQMQEAGYFDAAKRNWKAGMHPIPYVFWETDITKWLEAASYSLANSPDPTLEALVDQAIEFLVSLQQPDGYLNLYFTQVEPEKRWTNLRDWHELYCAGHLIEAAVAHFKATGKRTLLDPVCRYADYIDSVFGPEPGKRKGYCGHEEIELALVKLYRATGQSRYLALCRYFIEERGRSPHYFDTEALERKEDPKLFFQDSYEYNQSHRPVLEQSEIVGHAVRATYLFSAVADLAQEYQEVTFYNTCRSVWEHLTHKRLYITGGIGSSAHNEGFTKDYDLPNLTAYAETCAAIGLILWAHRMLKLEVDRRYSDEIERALYNGVLSGISLDGGSFFYVNPLESEGTHHRKRWFKCACCPPNLARLFMSLGEYIYGVSDDFQLLVHLYIQSSARLQLGNREVVVRQKSNYPWEGTIELEVETAEQFEFDLRLRIPGWCKTANLSINDEQVPLVVQNGYALVRRPWRSGDKLVLYLDMPVQPVYAHPLVRADIGQIALSRGPLVYCLESADNPVPLSLIRLSPNTSFMSSHDPDLLGGITLVRGNGYIISSDWSDQLYRSEPPATHSYQITAIPYYSWDHRQPGEMRVWIHTDNKL